MINLMNAFSEAIKPEQDRMPPIEAVLLPAAKYADGEPQTMKI